MAPKRASKPGKTSRYYQSKKGRKSYLKQKRKQKKINSTDVSHKRGRLSLEIPKKNRARGGAKRK